MSGKSLSISTGLELYNIPKTVSLPDFKCFTQSFYWLGSSLCCSLSLLATQSNHETPTLAEINSGPASENEKTQSAKSYLLFRSSNRSSGSIFLIS
ncbi:hypothetical protein [Acinetobacter schindleri]|uniref:hypothetical protein n=1 Tax=Acinetobacter schindleri TaxID=108981 RepID=UPI0013B08592|nr:hypothetical protein [Acinetobacter schindleri]QIC63863.1 hypothetical protein FSC11_05615 [Acinetobacter schindleri]